MRPLCWFIIALALLRGTTFHGPEFVVADQPPAIGAGDLTGAVEPMLHRSADRACDATRAHEQGLGAAWTALVKSYSEFPLLCSSQLRVVGNGYGMQLQQLQSIRLLI